MRVPLSWLKEFVELPVSAEELADRLTLAGLEVAAIDYIGVPAPQGSLWAPDLSGPPPEHIPWDREKVLVGELVEVKQHPDADRLTVPVVRYGEGKIIALVTGAPNIKVGMSGQKVALALAGARLIDGHSDVRKWITLKPGKIRGVVSEGMVCSELELGLSEEHEGILLLPDDAPVGLPLADYLGEVVLEIELTPNLGRALSIVGIAREAAAVTGGRLTLPEPQVQADGAAVEGRVKVEIEDPALCSRYVAGLIEGVRVGPSPLWMQRRLTLAGMRPVNNIVDVTNYVMLEWGQPLHAFDAATIKDAHVIVRAGRPGERLVTLDHLERQLSAERLLICDPSGPIAIAGVMGGEATEVSDQTSNIILESASFNAISIRRTATALRLPSEASRRFERGVDPELPPLAAQRALELMRQVGGGRVAQGLVDVYPQPARPRQLTLPARAVVRLLGIELSCDEIVGLLRPLGFGCQVEADAVLVQVPSYRLDVEIPADLVEEVARMYGYHRIPETLMDDTLPPQHGNAQHDAVERVRDIMAGAGLDETISYSFTNLAAVASVHAAGGEPDAASFLRLANPLTPEREYLRQSLLPDLLQTLASNLVPPVQRERVALFELGSVYLPQLVAVAPDAPPLPSQPMRLAIAMAGTRTPRSWQEQSPPALDFFDLKGVVEELLARLGVAERVSFVAESGDDRFHPGRTARLVLQERPGRQGGEAQERALGILGELHPLVRERLEIAAGRVLAAELDLDALLELRKEPSYRTISRFAANVQDIALLGPAEVPAARIAATIRAAGGPLLEGVELFDLYQGPQVPQGQRSLAFRLLFRAPDRTLPDQDVNKLRDKIVRKLQQEFGVTLRG